jgi:hypothetical protein
VCVCVCVCVHVRARVCVCDYKHRSDALAALSQYCISGMSTLVFWCSVSVFSRSWT